MNQDVIKPYVFMRLINLIKELNQLEYDKFFQIPGMDKKILLVKDEIKVLKAVLQGKRCIPKHGKVISMH